MFNLRFRLLDIVFVIALLLADLLIFGMLLVLFAAYEDNYDPGKGSFLSLQSMAPGEKAVYLGIYGWIAVNSAIVLRLLYRCAMQMGHCISVPAGRKHR